MAEITINGTSRTEFGKGAARRARRDGLVPAVIYGHGEKPAHIALPARELGVALKTTNVLLDIVVDGKTELTLPKSIVRDAIKGTLEHVDLVIVRRGERVIVSVPVHTDGKFDQDGILETVHTSIEVEAEATAIPNFLNLDMTGLMAGESLYAENVPLPAGVTLISDPKMTVVHLSLRSAQEEIVAAPVVAEGATPAEGAAAPDGAAAGEKKDDK
ncbi:MAG: 50S ribosomal protein L25/general stress protein Ctc [Actinomycetes bacterium]